MWLSRSNLQNIFLCTCAASGLALAGCSNTCFSGSVNNGNGSIGVKTGDPAATCSVPTVPAAAKLIVIKSAVCQQCTAASRVKNAFVTLRGVQLRTDVEDADSAQWVDIAPEFASKPPQIDLVGDPNSPPELLLPNATVPAGIYREVRLQFVAEPRTSSEDSASGNACGLYSNCVVMSDEHVELLGFPTDEQELFLSLQTADGHPTAVLPGTRVELRLTLQPHQMLYSSNRGLNLQQVLAGRAVVVRE